MPSAVVCVGPGVDASSYVSALVSTEISFSAYITNKVTHYVTTQQEFDKKTTRIVSAQRKNIFIVVESFLRDCVTSNTIVDPSPYLISPITTENNQQYQTNVMETSFSPETLAIKRNLDPNRKREIKIFISSTFRDMQDERSLLVSKIFPQLNAMCQERNVTFSFVDLRWGITEKDAKDDKALHKCLSHVDQCRPYFISFLGERYGWAQNDGFPYDSNLSGSFSKASKQFPWVNKYKDRSISELEIIYGALHPELSPEHKPLPQNESNCHRAFFFFRDPLSITKRFELGDPERKNYEEESSDGHRKLRELKDQIRQSGLPLVDGYSLDNLSEYILKYLTAAINQDFPPDEAAAQVVNLVSSQETTVYHRVEFVHKSLQNYASGGKKSVLGLVSPMVVSGEEGCGKTTVLLHWLQERMDGNKNNSEHILSYFIGENSLCPRFIAGEIFSKFCDCFNLASFEVPESQEEDDIRIFFIGVFDAIAHQLRAKGKKLVFALPGTHHLSSLAWLPEKFPSNIRVFLTSRGNENGKNKLIIPQWSGSDKETFIKQYLKVYAKKLESRYLHLLLQSNGTSNPLYLKIVLDQLVHMSSFENLSLSLSHYLASKTISQLFQFILADWETTFITGGSPSLVRDVLGILCLANAGITENELLDLSNSARADFNPFFYTLKYFTISSASGLLLYHNSLKQAVEQRYFNGANIREELLVRVSRYFETIPLSRSVHELPFALLKLSNSPEGKTRLEDFLSNPANISLIHETIPQEQLQELWQAAGGISLTPQTLTNNQISFPAISSILHIKEQLETTSSVATLITHLSSKNSYKSASFKELFAVFLEKNGDYDEAASLLTSLMSQSPSINVLTLLGLIRKKQGSYSEASALYHRCCEMILSSNSQLDRSALARVKMLMGDVERKQENYSAALQHYNDSYSESVALLGDSHINLVEIFRSIGLVYKKRTEYSRAKAEYAKGLHILEMKGQGEGKTYGFIMTEMADVYRKTSEFDTARGCYENALRIIEKSCGENHPEVAQVLNSFGILLKKQGKYSEALPLYQRSLQIIEKVFGKDHYKYAVCQNNIGDLHRKTGNFDAAILAYTDAQETFLAALGPSNTEYAEVSNNIGLVYKKQGKYADARHEYEKAIRIVFDPSVEYSAVNIKVGLFLGNLADVFRKEENYSQALRVYGQAQEIIRRCLGPEDVEIADIRQNRSLVYIDQGEYELATEELNIASRIISSVVGKNHPKFGFCLHKRGMLAAATGDSKTAIDLMNNSLKVLYAALDPHHPEVADVLISLGQVQSQALDSGAALKSFRSALEIIFFCFGTEHYKYSSVSESILELGGSIPTFQRATTKKKNKDWRKALDNLIAQNASRPTQTGRQPSSSNTNAQMVFLAMTNGWF